MSRLSIAALVTAPLVLSAAAAGYIESVQKWQRERESKLRSPDSWLRSGWPLLAEAGQQYHWSHPRTISSSRQGSAPPHIGRLHVEGNKVLFTTLAGTAVKVDGKPIPPPSN